MSEAADAPLAGAAGLSIAVFAPGGYDADPGRLRRATERLEAGGARVVHCLDPDARHGRFAGTDAERLRWLAAVVDAPDLDIAMALRGGYGATRLLPHVDFAAMAAAIRRRGRRFVGHSDFTALHLGLLATTGAISFAGPMAGDDFGGASVDAFAQQHFWAAMNASAVDVEFDAPSAPAVDVDGVLWGGNLAMVTSLIGTPWMPAVDGGILFVEDVNEQPYRIERMLLQLQQAGVLDRQRAVLCGDFSGYRVTPYDDGYGIADALDHVQRATSTPLLRGLPFGHVPRKLTLAVGARATVMAADGRVRLRQHWRLGA